MKGSSWHAGPCPNTGPRSKFPLRSCAVPFERHTAQDAKAGQVQLKWPICRYLAFCHARLNPFQRHHSTPRPMTASHYAVRAENIHKSFGSNEVLRGISYAVVYVQILTHIQV